MPDKDEILSRLEPCLHCGKKITEKELYHQDYIGDSYVGDEYEIDCECGISVTFTDKENLIKIWNTKL